MPRSKSSVGHKRRYRKVVKYTKGMRGKRKNVYTIAKHSMLRALSFAFAHRRKKKGDFRTLWIVRLNAALMPYGIKYSRFIHALKKANILLNRKALSNLAIEDAKAFAAVVDAAKKHLPS